jgi:hypothetical protein
MEQSVSESVRTRAETLPASEPAAETRQPPLVPALEATPAPRRGPPPPAIVDMDKALQESGLQLVETKSRAPDEAPDETPLTPAKRERRPPPASLSEPLVQVETRSEPEHPA